MKPSAVRQDRARDAPLRRPAELRSPRPGKSFSDALAAEPAGPEARVQSGLTSDRFCPTGADFSMVPTRALQLSPASAGAIGDPSAMRRHAERGLAGQAVALPHFDAIQKSFGTHSLEGVRAYVGGPAAQAARSIGAEAYTIGNAIAFRDYPSLHTAAHEAAHIVHQRAGVQLGSGVGREGDRYEQNADQIATEVQRGRTSQALLDGWGPAARSDPALQRLVQPLVKPAPAKAISIRDFIKLVEVEEARWPGTEQTQTALMITRLRKIFYGLPGWDKYLIPGAKGVDSGYDISEQEDSRENLSLFGPDADIVRSHQVVKDASGATPAIASQQEVRLEDGTFDDIGHVFAGLDAANHPDSVSAGLGAAHVADNKAAVTWTGDLGSAVTEIMFKSMNSGTSSAVAWSQAIVDEYASPQDMLGDIDAYVIADQFNTSNAAGKKVSELLRSFYLGATSSPEGKAREHRYSRFCASTGLTGWTGSAFGNEAAWLDRWTPEVAGAAALYFGATTAGKLGIAGRLGSIMGTQDSSNPLARLLLEKFLDALKTRVAAEPP